MKQILLISLLFGLTIALQTIPLQKQMNPQQEKIITQFLSNKFEKGFNYLVKSFLPNIDSSLPELFLSQTRAGSYTGIVEIGSPAQKFNMFFDTNSDNFWVISSKCNSVVCKIHNQYNSKKSRTYEPSQLKDLTLDYPTGALTGRWGYDTVTIAGKKVRNVSFAEIVKTENPALKWVETDGVIGLGLGQSQGGLPLFQQGEKQGVWPDNSFSFYLSKEVNQTGSALVLGGVDSKYQKSDFKYYPLTNDKQWNIRFNKVKFNGLEFSIDNASILTRSAIIVTPMKIATQIKESLGLSKDTLAVDCSLQQTLPPIVFEIDGDQYEIPASTYIVEQEFEGLHPCLFGIQSYPFFELENSIVLGEVFMQQYYTHFDSGNKKIGLSLAK